MENICDYIHKLFNSMEIHSFPFERDKIPLNGIYILFEKGEFAHSSNRIVRIGTHTGVNNLPKRLREHFVNENKDRSIFRRNIGRALLNKSNDNFLEQWEIDLTSRAAKDKYLNSIDLQKQKEVEREVTKYIQNNFSFIVFRVDSKDMRISLEEKIISTVSLCAECKQSETWLGNYSTVDKIRKSGLWLVQGLWKEQLNNEDITCIKKLLK
jgi:hypothetical protein